MKPVQLRLQAFGPFATSQTVDFFRVFHGGLFLIHGRTGAGKTSLLDGLCFSLFGRPSTAEREKDLRALRSDLADNSLATETELIFTVGEEAFRVHRIPSQLAPKKRGEGFTELKGSAELWRFHSTLPNDPNLFTKEVAKTENWIPVASKLESVDREIEALLGMNERQFRQVVILPQGKFREFLSSTSAERQTILERLFQTDRFSRLQSFFGNHVRELEAKWKSQTQEIDAKVKTTGLASVDEIPNRLAIIKDEHTARTDKIHTLRVNVSTLRDHMRLREDFETTSRRLSEIAVQLSELEKNQLLVTSDRQKIELFDLLSTYRTVNDNHLRGTKHLEDLRGRQKTSELEAASLDTKVKTLKQGLEKEQATIPTLPDLKTEYQKLRELFPVLSGLGKEEASLREEQRLLKDGLSDIQSRQAEIDRLVPEILRAQASLLQTDLSQGAVDAAKLEASGRKVSELELNYHQTEAARIAKRLTGKQPCPVCGSVDHPNPATAEKSQTVDLVTLKTAQEAHAKLSELLSTGKTIRRSSLDSIAKLIGSLGLEVSEAPVLVTQASTAGGRAVLDFSALADQTERKAMLFLKSRQELSSLKSALQATSENLDAKDLALRKRLEEIPPADRNLEQVIARGSDAKKQIEVRETYITEASAELAHLEAKLAGIRGGLSAQQTEIETLNSEVQRLFQERLAEIKSVVATHPEFDIKTWACTKEDRDRLLQSVRAFETKQIQTLAAREEGARRLAELKPLLDKFSDSTVAVLKAELGEAMLTLQNAETELARLTVERESLERLATSIQSDRKNLEKIKVESERALRINGLLSGDRTHNKLAVPLARFVLQSRFEDVLDQANRRLGRMSRGRYLLRRPALSRNLAQSQGLNLSVEDSMTGKERHADSLSGGESFMAALSLALGLADVVQSDLGGVKIDSVIIDEGFGTLDSESLDLALRTLVDLQAGGRMVGVISHVQELKSQIDQRLEVLPSPTGSSLRWEADRLSSH